mgnify:CR=1 FL=1|tara:strand:+ start:151 stop:507 length:357 start_codon:yes stop_codon:yes gene_type:complete
MNNQTVKYKYDRVENHLDNWLDNHNMTFKQAYKKYEDEIHNIVFNEDYFIIGYYKAEKWLINKGTNYTFEVLGYVLEKEKEMYGEIKTVFDNAETLVNHYVYWIGYEVVQDYINQLKQ